MFLLYALWKNISFAFDLSNVNAKKNIPWNISFEVNEEIYWNIPFNLNFVAITKKAIEDISSSTSSFYKTCGKDQ